jgi:hypothetical protein
MRTRFLLDFLAYVLPTFPIAWLWHMTVFKGYYEALEVYRDELLVPLGLASMGVGLHLLPSVHGRDRVTGGGKVRCAGRTAGLELHGFGRRRQASHDIPRQFFADRDRLHRAAIRRVQSPARARFCTLQSRRRCPQDLT